MNFLGANWKTSLSGIMSALFAFVAFSPDTFAKWPWIIELAKFATVGGLAAMGFSAKDSNVTGGTKANNPPPVELPAPSPTIPPTTLGRMGP